MQASLALQSIVNTGQHLPGAFRCALFRNGAQILLQSSAEPGPFTFTLPTPVQPGQYVAKAERLNQAGSPISPLVASDPLDVLAPETFEAPLTVTLTL